jgi:hypothetical protein
MYRLNLPLIGPVDGLNLLLSKSYLNSEACYSIHRSTFSIKFDCICGVNGDNLLVLPSKNYTDLPYILFAYSVGQHAILLYVFTLLGNSHADPVTPITFCYSNGP